MVPPTLPTLPKASLWPNKEKLLDSKLRAGWYLGPFDQQSHVCVPGAAVCLKAEGLQQPAESVLSPPLVQSPARSRQARGRNHVTY